MKILFVVPPFPNRVKEYLILPSLELCICSSILKENGHRVEMLDMKIDGLEVNDLYGILSEYEPDMVLIDDDPRVHCNSIKIIEIVKEIYGEEIEVALRGEIVSFIPQKVMQRNRQLDYVIRFDDDYALLNIINAKKNDKSLSKINNIGYRSDENHGFKITDCKPNNYSLDSLPMPDRKLYDIKKYLMRDSETIVRSSRGCPSNCLFCIKSQSNF